MNTNGHESAGLRTALGCVSSAHFLVSQFRHGEGLQSTCFHSCLLVLLSLKVHASRANFLTTDFTDFTDSFLSFPSVASVPSAVNSLGCGSAARCPFVVELDSHGLGDFKNRLNLHRDISRERAHPDRAARADAVFAAKNVGEKLA